MVEVRRHLPFCAQGSADDQSVISWLEKGRNRVSKMGIDGEAIETIGVDDQMRIGPGLFEDRDIEPESMISDSFEDTVSYGLSILCGVKLIEKIHFLACKHSSELEEIAANLTRLYCDRGDGEKSSALGCKHKVTRFIQEEIPNCHRSATPARRTNDLRCEAAAA